MSFLCLFNYINFCLEFLFNVQTNVTNHLLSNLHALKFRTIRVTTQATCLISIDLNNHFIQEGIPESNVYLKFNVHNVHEVPPTGILSAVFLKKKHVIVEQEEEECKKQKTNKKKEKIKIKTFGFRW